jgi:hypothetical protein
VSSPADRTPNSSSDPRLVAALAEAIRDMPRDATWDDPDAAAAALATHPALVAYLDALRPRGSHVVTRDTLEAALMRAFPIRPRVGSQAMGLRADVILAALAVNQRPTKGGR